MLTFVVLKRWPAERRRGSEERRLGAMALLVSCAADVSIVSNWMYFSSAWAKQQGGLYDLLLWFLLLSNILATIAYLILVSDARPLAWLAKKLQVRLSMGLVMFMAIMVDDVPQVILSLWLDSVKADTLTSCGDVGMLAVLNIMSAAYDALIRMAEAYDALSDTHATGWTDQMISKLMANEEIETLDFASRRLAHAEIEAIAQGIKANSHVTEVSLRGNAMKGRSCTPLGQALQKSTSLTILDLASNDLNPFGMKQLVQGMRANRKLALTTLYLQDNTIADDGFVTLAGFLKENKTLTTLDLSSNTVKAKGAGEFWKALAVNNSLTTVLVNNCKMGDDGAFHIDKLKDNKSITKLSIDDAGFTAKAAEKLAELLQKNRCLVHLSLADNHIGDAGAKAISRSFVGTAANKTVKTLVLERAGITNSGATNFVDVIRSTRTLTRLAMSGNDVNEDGVKTLRKHITKATTLKDVELGGE